MPATSSALCLQSWGTSLDILPAGIRKWSQLEGLRTGDCNKISSLPAEMGSSHS